MQPSRNSFLHHEYLRYVWTVMDAGHGQRPGTYYQVWTTSNRSTGAPPQTLLTALSRPPSCMYLIYFQLGTLDSTVKEGRLGWASRTH